MIRYIIFMWLNNFFHYFFRYRSFLYNHFLLLDHPPRGFEHGGTVYVDPKPAEGEGGVYSGGGYYALSK